MSETAAPDIVYRSCNLCEAHCGVAVTVDRAANRVIDIRGDENDVLSRGYVCPKAVGLSALSEDPDRLRAPVKKVDGEFVEISWDEALDLVSSRLAEIRERHGANSVATYLGNPNAHDFASNLCVAPLVRALGTKWRFSASSVDQLPKHFSSCLLFGGVSTFPIPDVDRTDFMLVLGANPLASNGSLMTAPDMRRRLRELRERGGELVVVDPRRSETARVADEHLAIRPGTDALFLFALVHVLFEEDLVSLGRLADFTNGVDAVRDLAREFSPEAVASSTGLEPEAIRQLARRFAAAPTAVCYGRIGTCTQEFGATSSWLVDVVNVLTGNLDRAGGAMFPWTAHEAADPTPRRKGVVPRGRWHSRVRGLPEFMGELPVATMAEEMEPPGEDRVRALLTIAGNPALSTPNADRLEAALEQLEFMVSIDLYVNETTRHADVILPVTAPLERTNYDMVFHGMSVHQHAKWSPAVLEPPPGVRPLWDVTLELAGRVHGADQAAVEELLLSGLLGATVGPGKACPETDENHARERLAKHEGPERLLDLMLRAGRFGDRLKEGAKGLSLDGMIESVHGVDLGPMEPRLPEKLGTESGCIELAPELFVEDVARLREAMDREPEPLVLIGRRQIRTNNSWMHNVPALAKGKPRCTLLVHPDDAARHGIAAGGRARIRSRVGEVEAPVKISEAMRPGVISLPHGFGHDVPGARLQVAVERQAGVNSNRLTDEAAIDILSGNAILNGIPVELEPA
ncbi:MAG: molybdopterin-dependent oxidoreductase [Deltaproteobacteria bacterium]|nr:molybdopterin-dependent oxidoreductase [Deltaproteobacteria bacterium]